MKVHSLSNALPLVAKKNFIQKNSKKDNYTSHNFSKNPNFRANLIIDNNIANLDKTLNIIGFYKLNDIIKSKFPTEQINAVKIVPDLFKQTNLPESDVVLTNGTVLKNEETIEKPDIVFMTPDGKLCCYTNLDTITEDNNSNALQEIANHIFHTLENEKNINAFENNYTYDTQLPDNPIVKENEEQIQCFNNISATRIWAETSAALGNMGYGALYNFFTGTNKN